MENTIQFKPDIAALKIEQVLRRQINQNYVSMIWTSHRRAVNPR